MIIPFLIPCIIAMFLAINMGGSGTAPSFSAIYGAGIIKKSLIPGLFGIAVFLGAILGGKETANTLGKSILAPELMSYPVVSVILFSISISLLIANLFGVPQSTSQSTVMAVTAPAVYYNTLNTHKLFYEILPTWFIMPLFAFVISYLIGKYIYKPLRRKGFTSISSFNNSLWLKSILVIMSLFVAFSIGTNNVANAVGPMASLTFNVLNVRQEYYVHVLILATLIIAPCFGIGSSLFGHSVVKNTGKEIVLFGKIEAAIIAFISASLLLTASLIKGIPTSLVQLNVGAIIGIGVAKLGYKNIFRKTAVNKFFIIWMVSPAIAFSLSYLLVFIVDNIEFQYL
ncbi:inorganic phosphate transporter [Plebeiibacterium sediminum]|uniref:Inorganic phosphate transporter n=1 Tax=Plebeiibacterium sediminum TaxID=2992112 RepID=A0AAE3M6U0_9BACT|nr:inorganic phosphate transporter [Plebeiobacterium sediminum]MCW3788107.1 inorganic phosphate transporter [Plebeiobacterium sediminum]